MWSRGVDDDGARHSAAVRYDGGDAGGVALDASNLGVPLDRGPSRLSRLRESHCHAVRIGNAVPAAECGREHAASVQAGCKSGRTLRIQPVDLNPEAALKLDVASERLHALWCVEQKQVAVLVQVGVVADDVRKVLET